MNIFNMFSKKETRSAKPMTGKWYDNLFGNGASYTSGGNVLKINTAYTCIRIISNTIASTPLKYYRGTDKGNEELINNQLTKLLRKPYDNMTYFQWSNVMSANLSTHGNAFALIKKNKFNKISALEPLTNDQVSIYTSPTDTEYYHYKVTLKSGRQKDVYPEDMIHYRNFSMDGIEGISPITYNRLLLDSANSQQEYQKHFIENSANVSGVIETEKNLSKEVVEELRDNFSKKFAGTKKAGGTPVLPQGLTYKQVQVMSPLDTDYINTKKLTEADIAKIYGVPVSMLSENNSTYSNAEQDSIKFQRYTLQPIQEMMAQELGLKLINSFNSENTFFEFSPDLIKLSSSKERAETISLLKRDGIITPNEAREYYNKVAKDNGDELVIQINTAPQNLVEEKMEKEIEGVSESSNVSKSSTSENKEEKQKNDNDNKEVESLKRELQKIKSEIGRIKTNHKNI